MPSYKTSLKVFLKCPWDLQEAASISAIPLRLLSSINHMPELIQVCGSPVVFPLVSLRIEHIFDYLAALSRDAL